MVIRTKVNGVGMVDMTCITVGELKEMLIGEHDNALIILQLHCNDDTKVAELSNVSGIKHNEWWDFEYHNLYDDESIEDVDIDSRDELHKCITLWGVYE